MKKLTIPAASAALLLAMSVGSAHATINQFSGSDDGASTTGPWTNSDATAASFASAAGTFGSEQTVTFEGLPLGYNTNFTAAPGVNVALTGPNYGDGYSGISTTTFGNLYGFNTTAGGSQWLGFAGGDATFTFAGGTNAVGFYLTGTQTVFSSNITVTFDDGTTQTLQAPINVDGGVSYFGFTDTQAFSSVTIANYSVDAWGVDDVKFTTAVPEPSSVLLMLAGLVGVAGVARRRRG